jgi:ABC-2 type transport system ATP-binding protein
MMNMGGNSRPRCVRNGRVPSSGDTEPGTALSVRSLTKRFGDGMAYQEVSFEVGRGEVFGFLGPSGAGKTTTVRTLGTQLPTPSSASSSP